MAGVNKMKTESKTKTEDTETRVTTVTGRVFSVTRKDSKLVQLTIGEGNGFDETVDFPLVCSELLLGAVKMGLVSRDVEYTQTWNHWCFNDKDVGSSTDYVLRVINGPMSGVYSEKSC